MKTGFEPVIFCILCACITTALRGYRHKVQDIELSKCLCLYQICAKSCLCTWLLMSDRRRRSHSAPASGHDVHRPDLDWNLTIASPWSCLPQSAGINWCHPSPDAVFKMQVTLSLAVPVPVPRPGAHWRPSQCVGPAFQLNTSTQKNNLIIEEATPAHQTCAQRSYLQSLER